MLIKGLQKTSLVDWDGKIVSVLFVAGCNFRCGFCFNPDLVNVGTRHGAFLPEISEQKIFKFLESRKKFIDGVVITGGEPCLQKDLPEFLKKIKLPVKLDTNGSNPGMLARLITQRLINYIAMDIKAPLDKYQKVTRNKFQVTNIKKSVDLIINSGINHEFRSTLVPKIHTQKDTEKMAKLIQGGKRYFLQNFRSRKTLDPKFQKYKPFTNLEKFAKIANKYIKTEVR